MRKRTFNIVKILIPFLLIVCCMAGMIGYSAVHSKAASPWIILSSYKTTLHIGQEFHLTAVTSDLSFPSFSSTGSSIASVDAYGRITGKKAGTCKIRVKSGKSEVYCQVQVLKTEVSLNKTSVSLEKNQSFHLIATTSNGSTPVFRCNKKSVALVSEDGWITPIKPGDAIITVKADQTEVICRVTIRKPTITLNKTNLTLYRCQKQTLSATISNKSTPQWSSSAKSVATVSDNGVVTAVKHGTATITVKADGVSKTCKVTVKSPTIKLSASKLSIKKGKKKTLTATVSSGNTPTWSSSNSAVASVSAKGVVTAKKKGTATITVKEDGSSAKCKVTVTK